MTGLAPSEAASAMLEAMRAAGMVPRDPGAVHGAMLRGGIVRFACEGERNRNGWAVLHLDRCPAGAFGNWRLDICGHWRADRRAKASRADVVAIAAKRAQERRAEVERHLEASDVATCLLRASKWPAAGHPYLVAKRLGLAVAGLDPSGLTLPLAQSGDDLLIPLRDADGRCWNLQRIRPDGQKRFLKHGRIAGCGWWAGRAAGAPVIALGEGFATMAAVHLATHLPVVATMSASNLETMALSLSDRFPSARLLVCADMDAGPLGNIGLRKATAAAAAVPDALVATPPSPAGWPANKSLDFADLWITPGGADLIRRALGLKE